MDFVPDTDADSAPPSVGEPLTSVAVEIVSPRPPPAVARPTLTTLHVVRPSVVSGQAVRSPVVRPQLVSVGRGQARVVPVVKMPSSMMAALSPSMFVMRPRAVSVEQPAPEAAGFEDEQLTSPVRLVVPRHEVVVDENPQPPSLQELQPHPATSFVHQPEHQPQPPSPEQLQTQPSQHHEPQPQTLSPAEPQSQPPPPAELQPQPSPVSDVQPQTAPPSIETEHRHSPAPANECAAEPVITLSCGPSYAAAMDSALQGDETPADENTEAEVCAVDKHIEAGTTAAIADDDEEDDIPLAARMRKSSSRGRGRKRPRSSSAPTAPPRPPPSPAPQPFICDCCQRRFPDRLALAAHERQHGDTLHSCLECRQTFTHALALRRHKLRHGQAPRSRSGRRRAKAPSRYLDAAWGEVGLGRSRGGVRPTQKVVACGVCNEELTPEGLTEHLSSPPGAEFFRCDECGAAFGQRCQLSRHGCRRQNERRAGLKGKKRRVSRASAAAAEAMAEAGSDAESAGAGDAALDSGSDWEAGEGADLVAAAAADVAAAAADDAAAAPDDATAAAAAEGAETGHLTCDVCQINFVSRRNLHRHRAQHEKGTRYSCEVCEQSYGRLDDLTRHSKSAHHQKRRFRCPRCIRVFTQKRIVQYHLRTHEAASRKSGSATGDSAKSAGGVKAEKAEPNGTEEIQDACGPGPVRYMCGECGAGFDTRRRYTRHQQLRHNAETPRYVCELCDASYARIDELTRHSMQVHCQKKTVPCPRCSRRFTQQRIVDYHVVGHDTKRVYMRVARPFRCESCQRGFSTKELLSAHSCRNGGLSGQRCVCDICGRGISCPQALRRHRLQHLEERPAKCETCGLGFIDELALSKHVLTHSEDKPYLCDHCGKGFRFKDYLVRHTRFHTGEKPYGCTACDKHFATSDTLNRHFLIHTGEKPFVCEICSRPFRQAQQLKTHMKVHRQKEATPILEKLEKKPTAQELGIRLSQMTGGGMRLVENVGGEMRLVDNGGGMGVGGENVGCATQLVENGGGLRMAGDTGGHMRLVENAGGEVPLAGDAGDHVRLVENARSEEPLAGDAGGHVRLVENVRGEMPLAGDARGHVRFFQNVDSEVRLVENAGGEVRFVENAGGEVRLVENVDGEVRLVENVGGEVRLVENVGDEVPIVGHARDEM